MIKCIASFVRVCVFFYFGCFVVFDELKAKLDDAEEAKENLSRLAEEQQEQLDRLRRRAKRMEEDITKVRNLDFSKPGRGKAAVMVFRNVFVFSSHSFWTSIDVPAGVTQEEGHTGFLIHLLSAVHALIFLARRIQPFLSLVDR